MKTLRHRLQFAVLLLVVLGTLTSVHAQLTPLQDAYTNSALPTSNYGTAVTLGVANTSTSIQTAYILFDLSSIPAGYTSANVAKATLKIYVNTANTGSFNVDYINGSWTEKGITYNNAPALGTTIVSSVSLTSANAKGYVLIDVTTAVGAWLNGTQANDGIALVANSPLSATIDSKENTGQSHPAELDIFFSGNGTITGVNTPSGSGLTGGGTSGTLNLSLLKSCSSNQVLQWNGSGWGCSSAGSGTVTQVNTGTGLTGGPITGTGTVSIASGGVGTAQIANAAITNPLLASAAVKVGNLNATGSSNGQVLTSNGSSVSWQNPSVPDPLSLSQGATNTATITGTATGSGGVGVVGSSSSASGVVGTTSGSGAAAIQGSASGAGGWGVSGTANNATGFGVVGEGSGTAGVLGLTSTGSGYSYRTAGVIGDTNSGFGVVGFSSTGNGYAGVWGDSNATGGYGTAGSAYGTAFAGVYGNFQNPSGIGRYFAGVIGDSNAGDGVTGLSSGFVGVFGQGSNGGDGVFGQSDSGDGVSGQSGTGYAGYFYGNVNVSGAITAGTKDFLIDHPLDPANKYLYHASVESSEMMNIYTGNVTTDAQGHAIVQLPDWFEKLNRDFRYQLTVIGQFAQAIVSSEIENNRFVIQTDKPGVKVSWQVTGVRQDAYAQSHPLVVEVEKPEKERGRYMHPEAFGQPKEEGIGFIRHPNPKQHLEDMKKGLDRPKGLTTGSSPASKSPLAPAGN
jgi:hypothetical protein